MNNYKIKEMLLVGFRENSTLMSMSTPLLAVFDIWFTKEQIQEMPRKISIQGTEFVWSRSRLCFTRQALKCPTRLDVLFGKGRVL